MAGAHEQSREVKTHDDRVLAVEISGALDGPPVFLLHGTPGSRNGPKPRASVLYRQGIRLITYDRPGYGGSSRFEGRSVADAAADVESIADALGLDAFAVVGRSGGGPHALACAAVLNGRVTRTAGLVSVARPDAVELDWFGQMTDENVAAYTTADNDPNTLIEHLRLRADRTVRDPESMVAQLHDQMTPPDRRIVDDMSIRRLLHATYSVALAPGPWGWIDDLLALRSSWGFSLDAIQSPVRLWHGTRDNFAPVSHTIWLASQIAHAEVVLEQGSAHFGAVEILPSMLAWLVDA
jgi:pimeloyl-ACP methyl ester carboxylesterase